MSVSINIEDVIKRYGDKTIIDGLSLHINPGEFFTLLGPSGCGKTTLLRMIIGFNSIEGGEIEVDGKLINNISVSKRNMGMVFQNYAIFPHMSVKDNVAFGLKNKNLSKQDMEDKIDEILKVVKIESFRDRMPDQLSGGQQQRVALARAIVIHPQVLLIKKSIISPETSGVTFSYFIKFFERKFYGITIINSFKVTIVTTILPVAIGLPVAYIMRKVEIRGNS